MRLFLLSVLLASFLTSSGQTCDNLIGEWKNDLGSLLVIASIDSAGSIDGEYRSSTGVDGKVFPLVGWVNNYQSEQGTPVSIAFTVRWEGYKSITSWSGSCDSDENGPKIKTLWHLVRPEQEFEWERIIANSSTFRPFKRN